MSNQTDPLDDTVERNGEIYCLRDLVVLGLAIAIELAQSKDSEEK